VGSTALCMSGLAAIQLATPPTLFDLDVALRLTVDALAGVLAPVSRASFRRCSSSGCSR
jgi:hypothetical protein